MKRDISILAIGDKADYDAYQKFNREKTLFLNRGFEYVTTDYRRFLGGKIPQIKTKKIVIFLFFPFSYWNKYIEHKNYKGIYGNRTFYRKFISFWNRVEKKVKRYFGDKEILFINDPRLCGKYRDKLVVTQKLSASYISEPRLYKTIGIKEIQNKLSRGHKFFLKPRYGSMGKGITFLSQSSWQTNFILKDNKIISRRSDHGWRFREVTGNHNFLKQLLKKDILIQESVGPMILNGNMVDLRIYTFLKKVIYIYPRKNRADKITTNISQGGRGAPELLKILPKHLIVKAKKEAVRVSEALNITLGGIDIVSDRNFENVYIIDVNVFPGFPRKKTFNLTRCLAEELGRVEKIKIKI